MPGRSATANCSGAAPGSTAASVAGLVYSTISRPGWNTSPAVRTVIRRPPEVNVKSEPTEVPVSVRNSVLATTSGVRAVAVELLAATSGLGFLIMQAGDYLNTALVFAGIITIAITGLILDTGLRGLLTLADPSRRR